MKVNFLFVGIVVKKDINIFCDGSVDPKNKIGFAAYFILEAKEFSFEEIKKNVKIKKFENTSSTKLELEALLWALKDESIINKELIIYTDCQNILSLEKRRKRLEDNDFKTSSGKDIKNAYLYKGFYKLSDELTFRLKKVKGHKKSSQKNEIDKLFNIVDKASRRALRNYNNI